mgnify:CR=1 FL=1
MKVPDQNRLVEAVLNLDRLDYLRIEPAAAAITGPPVRRVRPGRRQSGAAGFAPPLPGEPFGGSAGAEAAYFAYTLLVVSVPALLLAGLGAMLPERPRMWVLAAAQSLLLLLFVADARLYQTMGLHLYGDVVTEALGNTEANRALHLSARSVLSVGALALGLFAAELGLWLLCTRLARWASNRVRWPGASRVLVVALGLALLAGVVGSFVWRSSAARAAGYLDGQIGRAHV